MLSVEMAVVFLSYLVNQSFLQGFLAASVEIFEALCKFVSLIQSPLRRETKFHKNALFLVSIFHLFLKMGVSDL